MNKKVFLYKKLYSIESDYKRNLEPMYRIILSCINFKISSLLDYGCGKGNLAEIFKKYQVIKTFKYDPAIIEVNAEEIKDVNEMEILTGMQANASIIGTKRTILSYITNPISKLSSYTDSSFPNIPVTNLKILSIITNAAVSPPDKM